MELMSYQDWTSHFVVPLFVWFGTRGDIANDERIRGWWVYEFVAHVRPWHGVGWDIRCGFASRRGWGKHKIVAGLARAILTREPEG